MPLAEVALEEASRRPAFTICFLLFEGAVVWGRDLGAFGADLWACFVQSRRPSGDCGGVPERPMGTTCPSAQPDATPELREQRGPQQHERVVNAHRRSLAILVFFGNDSREAFVSRF